MISFLINRLTLSEPVYAVTWWKAWERNDCDGQSLTGVLLPKAVEWVFYVLDHLK